MNLNIFQWRSLRTRLTLFTLAILVIGIWSLSYYASRMLREDIQGLLGEQQFSTVSLVAANVDHELQDRVNTLEFVSRAIEAPLLDDPAALQKFLEQRFVLDSHFNGGVTVYRLDGTTIADVPLSTGRLGVNYMDRDYLAGALREGKATIGRPVLGPKLKAPVFVMAVPIRDTRGKVIGALGGVTNLGKPNFLNSLTENHYGRTGGYLLVAPQYRLIVTASDKSRIMEALPAPGINPSLDRFVQGYEGSDIFVNQFGVDVLASAKSVPAAGWYVAATLPTAEAFAPIRAMQRRMLLATLLLTLLAGLLTQWMLRRQLSPMLAAVKTLAAASNTDQPPQPLPVTSQNEIGDLIGGFNRLLEILRQREVALRESEGRFRDLTEMSSDFYWESDAEHRLTKRTESKREAAESVFREASSIGKRRWEISYLSPDESGWQKHRALLDAHLPFRDFEISRLRVNGAEHHISVSGNPVFNASGEFTGYRGVGADITVRKLMEEAREEALSRLQKIASRLPGVVYQYRLRPDGSSCFPFASEAIREIYRVSPEDVREDASKVFVNIHPDDYDAVGASIQKSAEDLAPWSHEYRVKFDDGTVRWLFGNALPEREADGSILWHGFITDISERKLAEEKINELAFYDPLTRLPNRRLLLDRLKQALASSTRNDSHGALLFIDLDNFKTLNDTLGHDVGDLLLQQVAQRLATCVREGDTVARQGGDEFVVMLEDLSQSSQEAATQTETVGEKILATLNQAYQLASFEHRSAASIGATLFMDHQGTIDDLLKRADLAMYQAKAAGRNTLRFFDPEMQAVVTTRAALEAALREAVLNGQFVLYYQAQVVGAGRLTGAEALLRWQHPERGLVPPAEFIFLAEDTGLILPLGDWVLETTCALLAGWAARPEMAHLTVAVNVSARQFRHRDFVDQVLAVLGRTGANPQRLKLELTESLLVDDVEDVIAKMTALKAKGVGFSLDDFGTGYSSLSYLKRLPLDQLKIDQSFVRDILTDPNDAAIAKMVVALAESLGLVVIAEGVEIEAQRDFLARHGCHAYQGYLFSRPLPLEEFEAFVQRC